ncbi:MAG TPA: peptidoglycan editing factor PgeF [Pyrinomonadaceae bacterium]|nr:peptidoglycan editing factor PgeF [Pyrinomonadaceae bacterium]
METITVESGFVWREGVGGVRLLVCEALEREGFANAFPTRAGGTSPFPADALNLAGFDQDSRENILENRRRLLSALGGRWRLAACWQVHGSDILVVKDPADSGSEQNRCDALTTRTPGVLLGVKTADCVPVLIGDPRTGACAAVHAGWRGTLAGIARRALARMGEEFGTRAADVRVAVGPAALDCCYEVGPEVVVAFRENFPGADSLFTPTREGHALVNLHRANSEQLVAAGVEPERIHLLPLCTMCRTDLFFSYRKEKRPDTPTGRHLSVVGRRA